MAIEITNMDNSINYIRGTIDDYSFSAKHFDESSRFGIDSGRTSKLTITKDGEEIVHYDRGWDNKPVSIEHLKILNEIVDHLERLPKRYENEIEIIL